MRTISILPALFSNDKTSCCVCNYVISFLIHIPVQSFNSGSVPRPCDVSLIAVLSRFIRPNLINVILVPPSATHSVIRSSVCVSACLYCLHVCIVAGKCVHFEVNFEGTRVRACICKLYETFHCIKKVQKTTFVCFISVQSQLCVCG